MAYGTTNLWRLAVSNRAKKLNKSQENSREAGRVQISLQEDDVSKQDAQESRLQGSAEISLYIYVNTI